MPEKFRLDRNIGFQNTFYTIYINVIIDSIGPSIILRSILRGSGWLRAYQNDYVSNNYVKPAVI